MIGSAERWERGTGLVAILLLAVREASWLRLCAVYLIDGRKGLLLVRGWVGRRATSVQTTARSREPRRGAVSLMVHYFEGQWAV